MIGLAALAPLASHAGDAYVQAVRSTGQALVTDYYVNPKTRIIVDFAYDATDNGARLFGVYQQGATAGFYCNGGKLYFESGTGAVSPNTATGISADTSRHVVVLDCADGAESYLTTDGEKSADFFVGESEDKNGNKGSVTATATHPLVAFGTFAQGEVGFNASAKIYSLQISESGETVRDYVPALRDGKPGLYDKIGGTFLANGIGDADLAYGGDIFELPDDPYVEFTGEQAINTGVYMDNTTKLEIDFALTETGQGGSVSGAFSFTGYNRLCFPYLNGGQFKFFWGGSNADTGGAASGKAGLTQDTLRHLAILDAPNQRALVVGVSGKTGNAATYDYSYETPAPYPIDVGSDSRNAAGTTMASTMAVKARVYGVKIWQGGKLVRDMTPARQNGVAGLYDKVSGLLFSDYDRAFSSGTALVASADLPEAPIPYVEATGSQAFFIPTSVYKVNSATKFVVDYAFTEAKTNKRLFGVYQRGATTGFYQNATGNGEIVIEGGNASNGNTKPGLTANTLRHTLTLFCGNADKSSLVTGSTTNWTGNLNSYTTSGTVATGGLSIFSTSTSDTAPGNFYDKARIYRFKIYDGEDLKLDLAPYVKDGVVGFRDAESGSFFSPYTGAPLYGGDIDGESPAYIQAVRTSGSVGQAIDTGYAVNPKTKIVVEFAYDDTSNDGRLFGAYNPAASRSGLYCKNGKFIIESYGGEESPSACDTLRHTATIDYSKTSGSSLATDGAEVWSGGVKGAISAASSNPLVLFGTHTGSIGYFASAKIYSFIIYEGDDIVHEYLPYKKGDVVGFYDTKAATEAERVLTDVNGGSFAIGGKGVGGAERWLVKPEDRKLTKGRGGCTLSASAAGAVAYRWTQDGEAIDGGEDGDLAVAWEKRGDVVYAAIPVYELYGRQVEGEPVSATVTHVPAGTVVIIR